MTFLNLALLQLPELKTVPTGQLFCVKSTVQRALKVEMIQICKQSQLNY